MSLLLTPLAVPAVPSCPPRPANPAPRARPSSFARAGSLVRRTAPAALAALLALTTVAAAEARSPAARAEFQQQQPCPANGRKRGACPGFQVDHRVPLKCGGADAPHNMQWLTVAQHKAKTAREAKACRKRRSR